jgi:hypothetical protein
MLINQMSHTQKKWFSLAVAVAVVWLTSMLTSCDNRQAKQAAAQQKASNEAAAVFLKQGDGKIRQWGSKVASAPDKEADDAKK